MIMAVLTTIKTWMMPHTDGVNYNRQPIRVIIGLLLFLILIQKLLFQKMNNQDIIEKRILLTSINTIYLVV